jgi:hypothetical protein
MYEVTHKITIVVETDIIASPALDGRMVLRAKGESRDECEKKLNAFANSIKSALLDREA